jgi:hypothetical protein
MHSYSKHTQLLQLMMQVSPAVQPAPWLPLARMLAASGITSLAQQQSSLAASRKAACPTCHVCSACRPGGVQRRPSHLHMPHALRPQVFKAGTAAADAQLLQLQANDSSSSCSKEWHGNGTSGAAEAGKGAVNEYGFIEVEEDAGYPEDYYTGAAAGQQQQQYSGYEDVEEAAPVCKFFLSSSGCRRGQRCAFRHARPTCRFFLSRSGCMYGAACRFLHHTPSSDGSSSHGSGLELGVDTASPQKDQEQQQQQEQGLAFDWGSSRAAGMPAAYEEELINGSSSSGGSSSSDSGLILLLGEGDFSFTASLLRRRTAARPAAAADCDGLLGRGIVASSYEQQQGLRGIYPGRALEARLQQLEAAGAQRCLECKPA